MKSLFLLFLVLVHPHLDAAHYGKSHRAKFKETRIHVRFSSDGSVNICDYNLLPLSTELHLTKFLLKPFHAVIKEKGALRFLDDMSPKIFYLPVSSDDEESMNRARALYDKAKFFVERELTWRAMTDAADAKRIEEIKERTEPLDEKEEEDGEQDDEEQGRDEYDPEKVTPSMRHEVVRFEFELLREQQRQLWQIFEASLRT